MTWKAIRYAYERLIDLQERAKQRPRSPELVHQWIDAALVWSSIRPSLSPQALRRMERRVAA